MIKSLPLIAATALLLASATSPASAQTKTQTAAPTPPKTTTTTTTPAKTATAPKTTTPSTPPTKATYGLPNGNVKIITILPGGVSQIVVQDRNGKVISKTNANVGGSLEISQRLKVPGGQ